MLLVTILKYIFVFINHLILFLLLTMIIATITLIERKVLALIQRRVGPNYIGYKGRLQFIADALKLLAKNIVIISDVNKLFFYITPSLVLIVCYLFWINLIWGPNLTVCEIEYNLLFMFIISSLYSILLFGVGVISKSKYSTLASYRVLIVSITLDIFLNFFIIFFLIVFESFSFYYIVSFQNLFCWGILVLFPITPLLLIVFLLETGRIPFDLGEAESELIAGYTTEMGGFFFVLFYLGEYFHLYCFSTVYALCLFGGWVY